MENPDRAHFQQEKSNRNGIEILKYIQIFEVAKIICFFSEVRIPPAVTNIKVTLLLVEICRKWLSVLSFKMPLSIQALAYL